MTAETGKIMFKALRQIALKLEIPTINSGFSNFSHKYVGK